MTTEKKECVWCETNSNDVVVDEEGFITIHKKCYQEVLEKYDLALDSLEKINNLVVKLKSKILIE
jgi:hypothetical protein